jgi:clan AA aspartic protease
VGFTRITVQVCNSNDLARCEELEVLVDTGAMLSVIPAPILQRLGIKPVGRRRFRSFDGRSVQREVGPAAFSYQGDIAFASVIFGGASDTPLLGVTALEMLGYEVDPVSQELKPIELLMLTQIPLVRQQGGDEG